MSGDGYTKLGQAVQIMLDSNAYSDLPLVGLSDWINPAIRLNQIHFFRDANGKLLGYMTWAFFAEDTERRWTQDPDVLLHISEWNEGDRLWILNWVVLNGETRRMARQAVETMFPRSSEVKWLRRNADGSVRKIYAMRRRSMPLKAQEST